MDEITELLGVEPAKFFIDPEGDPDHGIELVWRLERSTVNVKIGVDTVFTYIDLDQRTATRFETLDQLVRFLRDVDFRALLSQLPYSDEELAHLLDVSRPTVCRWRSGKHSPHPLLQQAIRAILEERGPSSMFPCSDPVLTIPLSMKIDPRIIEASVILSSMKEGPLRDQAKKALLDAITAKSTRSLEDIEKAIDSLDSLVEALEDD